MLYGIFDYMGAFLRSSFAHVDNVVPVIKTITWLLLSRLQGNKPHRNSPEPSESCSGTYTNTRRNSSKPSGKFRTLPREPTPTRAGSRTLRNLPRPSGTNLSEPSGTYLLNLRQHTLEPSEIFQNLPPEPTPRRDSQEPSGTFRNLPPEPAPATRTGTHRSLSGLKTPLLAYAVGEKKPWLSPTAWQILESFCTRTLRNFVCYACARDTSATLFAICTEPEPSETSSAICARTIRKCVPQTLLAICAEILRTSSQPSGTPQNLVCTRPFKTSSAICIGTSGTLFVICTRTLQNFISHLHRNPPQPCAICTVTLWNFISHLHRNPCLQSAPQLSGTLSAICTEPSGTSSAFRLGTLRNLVCYPEPQQLSAFRNLISFLHQNRPEPHQPSAPEPSGTSLAMCAGTLQNLTSHLHQNSPEPHQPSAPEGSQPSGTLRNLLRNLVLQLHRIAPKLCWAKDPIASFAVGEKDYQLLMGTEPFNAQLCLYVILL